MNADPIGPSAKWLIRFAPGLFTGQRPSGGPYREIPIHVELLQVKDKGFIS
jgi:hypothetical protein